jgi:uncharacterized damage-inducible protein DinB
MLSRDGLLAIYGWQQECFDILFAHCGQFTEQDLQREFDGFGQPSLWASLLHIVAVENYWLFNLSGQWALTDEPKERTVAALDGQRKQVAAAMRAWLNSKSDEELNTIVTYEGDPNELPVVQTPARGVQHIVTHGFHHKGQAVAQCRLLGRPAPDTDMVRWVIRDQGGDR